MKARYERLCGACLLVMCGFAAGQTPGSLPYPAVPIGQGERAFALSLSKMPLEQAKAAIAQADKSLLTVGSAIALRDLGTALRTSHPKTSIVIYQEALEIARPLQDNVLLGNLLYGEADSFRFSGDAEGALPLYDASLAAYTEANAGPSRVALPLIGRALAKRDMGDIEGAIEDDLLNLAKNKEAGDEVGMARALNNLGLAEQLLGHYQTAREHYGQGLVFARAQKQRMGEAFLLNNIANTYIQEDNVALATEYCLAGLKIKEEAGSKDDLISSLVILGRVYMQAGKLSEAMRTLDRASTLAHESARPTLIALAMSARGDVESELKQYDAAQKHLDEALAATRQVHERLREFQVLEQIAELEFDTQRYAEAARDAEVVLAFATAGGIQRLVAHAADTAGGAHLKLREMVQARAAFETSVAAYEVLRENIAGGDQVRSEFFARHSQPYQELAALDISEGRIEDALALSEREKGRALLDMLTRGKSSLSKELLPSEKSEENHLRAHIAKLEMQRLAVALDNIPDGPQLAALDQQLQAAHTAMSSFRERMSVAHPDIDRHRGNARLITLRQTAGLLPNSSTAILEYEVTPAATYLFVITPGRNGPALHLYTIAIKAAALSTRVNAFSKALASRSPAFAAEAVGLYRLLLSPAKVQLAGRTSLIIVPSGELWHLPFQTLRNADGKYLLDEAAISYAPSLSVLRAYAVQQHSFRGTHSLLAFGDPANNLPEAAREARTVAALYAPSRVRTFIGRSASKENFRTYAGRYDIVHLATHGLFDDLDPMYSHLQMSRTGTSTREGVPTQLDASEIAEMKMSAGLVVLSACQTANGKYRDGEGLIGLSWSFLAAGSQSAIASQWRVESSSTTELMIAFHRNLKSGLGKAESLRRAELAVAHNPRYDHPFYWAGFALLGED